MHLGLLLALSIGWSLFMLCVHLSHLRSDLHCLRERRRSCGEDHEFLESQTVPSMLSTVDHVERWHRHNQLVVPRQIREVLRDTGRGGRGSARFIFAIMYQSWHLLPQFILPCGQFIGREVGLK